MEEKKIVIGLFRKIICSLICINKKTTNEELKIKSDIYLNEYITKYDKYVNEKTFTNSNFIDIIDFCNECYSDSIVFDYAEDVEYGVKELQKKIK
ncbi:MAG: hypothetical protein Q4G04_02500 [bacterium]|nr:hypothetical protein [bacterium]